MHGRVPGTVPEQVLHRLECSELYAAFWVCPRLQSLTERHVGSDCFRAGNKASILTIDSNHDRHFAVYDACPSERRIPIQGGADGNAGAQGGSHIVPDYFL